MVKVGPKVASSRRSFSPLLPVAVAAAAAVTSSLSDLLFEQVFIDF